MSNNLARRAQPGVLVVGAELDDERPIVGRLAFEREGGRVELLFGVARVFGRGEEEGVEHGGVGKSGAVQAGEDAPGLRTMASARALVPNVILLGRQSGSSTREALVPVTASVPRPQLDKKREQRDSPAHSGPPWALRHTWVSRCYPTIRSPRAWRAGKRLGGWGEWSRKKPLNGESERRLRSEWRLGVGELRGGGRCAGKPC